MVFYSADHLHLKLRAAPDGGVSLSFLNVIMELANRVSET